jgi:hypothetical protein
VSNPAGELLLRNHLMMAFATPVVAYPWPESDSLNRELAELVLAAERKSEGISRSNVGGGTPRRSGPCGSGWRASRRQSRAP